MENPVTRDAIRRTTSENGVLFEASSGANYALVIGVNNYQGVFNDLNNARKDAQVIGRRLEEEFGFTVTHLYDEDATLINIRNQLIQWKASTKPEDDILIFFAGHGSNILDDTQQPVGYLIPFGSSRETATWLPEHEIIQHTRNMSARRILMVLDACYAGTAFRLRDDIQPGARLDQVIKIIVAGTEDQPVLDGGAKEHSIFTRAILDGLDGLADIGQQPDGIVAANELIAYVRSEVPWRSRLRGQEQTPVGGSLGGTRGGLDFEFLPSKARLPATILRNLYSQEVGDLKAAVEQLKARMGTSTADLAARELTNIVNGDSTDIGEVFSAEDLMEVQTAAVQALGALGHPDGFEVLTTIIEEPSTNQAIRSASTTALGLLISTTSKLKLNGIEPQQQAAIEVLVEQLKVEDSEIREATKRGLSYVPKSAQELASSLDKADQEESTQILDALARIAIAHPHESGVWPDLKSAQARLTRRYYLTRRRLEPNLPTLLIRASILSIFAAIGLSLAYLTVSMLIFRDTFGLYAPAIITVCSLAGIIGGTALVFMPPITTRASRFMDSAPTIIGGLLGGLVLGLSFWLPNNFLAIGCRGDCPWFAWVLWLPGLIIGPILGFTLVCFVQGSNVAPISDRPRRLNAFTIPFREILSWIVLAMISGMTFAVTRIPTPLSSGDVHPQWVEVILWGVGGFLFGLTLAMGWSLIPPIKEKSLLSFKRFSDLFFRY
ncbi:caspase family protein [Chloroflexota bacterium]